MNCNVFILFILLSSSCFSTDYTIKALDRHNQTEINSILELFSHPQITPHLSHTCNDIQRWINNPAYTALIIHDANNILCGALFYFVSKHENLWIRTIAVHPAYQNKGIAKTLLQNLELLNYPSINITISAKNIAINQLLTKLNYVPVNFFIKMEKIVVDTNKAESFSSTTIQALDPENEQQVSEFCNLFDINEIGFYGPEDIRKLITKQSRQFLCALNTQNQVVGGLIYITSPTTQWILDIISVNKQYRNCGIATQLIHAAEQLAAQEQVKHLTLTVHPDNIAAQHCYTKCGFTKVDEIYQMSKK